jgi:hypothetical protein
LQVNKELSLALIVVAGVVTDVCCNKMASATHQLGGESINDITISLQLKHDGSGI